MITGAFIKDGWVAEWLKAPVLKTGRRVSVSGVRIPPHLPFLAFPGDNMKNLQTIAHDANNNIDTIIKDALTAEQKAKIQDIVDDAVVKALLEGQHKAVDAALQCPDADQDLAHKIATEIRLKNDVLIANLSSLR